MTGILTLTMNPALDVFTSVLQVRATHKLRCGPALLHPGGGGINVARVLSRFGVEVLALYPQGGVTGEQLSALLRAEHVSAQTLAIRGETRESFSVHETTSGLDWRFVLPGPALSDDEWQACLEQAAATPVQSGLVVASGSLPPGVPQDFYARLARRLAARGLRLALDTSGPALADALEAGVHLVKPSLRELGELTGAGLATREQQLAACRGLVAQGRAEFVALSLGSEGAMLVGGAQAWHARALQVDVVSTIGAGDSFLAGLLLALTQGETPDRALAHAIAASAAALLSSGTALCQAADLERLLPRVRVEALA